MRTIFEETILKYIMQTFKFDILKVDIVKEEFFIIKLYNISIKSRVDNLM